ncbi:unnamed protein product [Pocillopora meandrina]|uniref:Uncharacterized protein n=1 Tax=Pocillopora meandrina TaxID=46732 RepID=A0AAU9XVF6_9CNID|nr:unnamed protein product [Pocillopora meandrina]
MLAQLIIIITCIVIIFKLVIIFILAFVKQRVKSGLQNCNGYPGLLIPFDFLSGFGNRFTMAVMFGATSSACLNMFLQPKNGISQMPDPAGWVQDYCHCSCIRDPVLPIFCCLTTDNRLAGSLLGFLYVTISDAK